MTVTPDNEGSRDPEIGETVLVWATVKGIDHKAIYVECCGCRLKVHRAHVERLPEKKT